MGFNKNQKGYVKILNKLSEIQVIYVNNREFG